MGEKQEELPKSFFFKSHYAFLPSNSPPCGVGSCWRCFFLFHFYFLFWRKYKE